jgi:hypothetical protein
MAELLQTPTCEITGLPLPIVPIEPPEGARFTYKDYHHHFHPREDPLLKGLSGKALRYSRGQWGSREVHNWYHRNFSGPELPSDDDGKFKLAVLACAGVVPRQAIHFERKNDFEVIDIPDDLYRQIAAPSTTYVERAWKLGREHIPRKVIGNFFADYAVRQNVRLVVSDKVIGEFLEKKSSPERKKELGNFILKEALNLSIENIAPLDEVVQEEHLILSERPKPLARVVRKFCTKDLFPYFMNSMAENLSAQTKVA